MSESASPHIEYADESELLSEFHGFMKEPENVEKATLYLYDSLIDESILGVVFEYHHDLKTGKTSAIEGEPEDSKQFNLVDLPNIDVFGSSSGKKTVECTCPNCSRLVAAARFAPHLEKCMGMGRNSSRIASRRIASSREGTNYFGTAISDDEDDVDWSGEKRKKKYQSVRANGTKKNGKSS